jgi:hypothetical protein
MERGRACISDPLFKFFPRFKFYCLPFEIGASSPGSGNSPDSRVASSDKKIPIPRHSMRSPRFRAAFNSLNSLITASLLFVD